MYLLYVAIVPCVQDIFNTFSAQHLQRWRWKWQQELRPAVKAAKGLADRPLLWLWRHFVDQQQRRVPTRGLQPAWWPFASAPGNVKSERASRSGHSNQTWLLTTNKPMRSGSTRCVNGSAYIACWPKFLHVNVNVIYIYNIYAYEYMRSVGMSCRCFSNWMHCWWTCSPFCVLWIEFCTRRIVYNCMYCTCMQCGPDEIAKLGSTQLQSLSYGYGLLELRT